MYDPDQAQPDLPLTDRETIDLSVEPGQVPSKWSWLIDRNPLFLISGVCMLGGCFLISGVIHGHDPAEIGDGPLLLMLVALLVVLNIYEFAVIGLAVVLSRSRSLVRDTRHLLGLALLLLVDASFVYNETSIFKPEIGSVIAGVATLLAVTKAWWIMRALGIVPTRSAMTAVMLSLLAMYVMPVGVRLLAHDGFLSQPMAMLVWCCIGGVVAMYALPRRWVSFAASDTADHAQLQRLVAGGLIVLPLVSLIGHAAALLWVYENAFELSMLSPVLLGLAAIVLRQQAKLGGPSASAKAAGLITACAIVPCLLPSQGLTYESAAWTWLAFSPLRGVLLLSSLMLFWAWWMSGRGLLSAVVVPLPWLLAALGHTPSAMIEHARWVAQVLAGWLPRTQLQWGAMAITAAFVCLIAGGLMSWRRVVQGRRDHDHGT